MSTKTEDIADGILEWVLATCPDIKDGYNEAVGTKEFPLPDVAVEIQSVQTLREPDANEFPGSMIEQAMFRRYAYDLILVVEPKTGATQELSGYVDALTESLLSDPTLGDRVPAVSPVTTSSFTPPFVEFDDTTQGRMVTMGIIVGDLVEMEE